MWCYGKAKGAAAPPTDSAEVPTSSGMPSTNEPERSPAPCSPPDSSWEFDAELFTKELTCSLCLDLFREPVVLPCGHNFCKACIESKCLKKEAFVCPDCQTKFLQKKYVENTPLKKLAENLRSHQLANIQQKCLEHQEPVTLYWKPQKKLACFSCRDTQEPEDQSTHFVLIPDAVQIFTAKLISLRIKLRSVLMELESLKDTQEEKISSLEENKLQLQHHIYLEFLKLHHFLHDKEKMLTKQLKEESELLLQEMKDNVKRLEDRIQMAKHTMGYIQSRLYQQTSSAFLKDIEAFMDWLMKKTEQSSASTLISGTLSTGQYKGPIQYMVWKEMKSALIPDISFLTLDPATAHPNLVFSDDLTSVRHDDARQILQDTPERFDSSVSVLGSEGFTTGRHYWEVKVEKKTKWTLGVVKESIDRKGNFPLTPKAGYWLIKLRNKGHLKAVDVPPRSLTPSSIPCRVGVYLDYEGGQVSFYDAEKMTPIYTFMDTFLGRLYPYFCPCLNDSGENKEPLKIVSFNL